MLRQLATVTIEIPHSSVSQLGHPIHVQSLTKNHSPPSSSYIHVYWSDFISTSCYWTSQWIWCWQYWLNCKNAPGPCCIRHCSNFFLLQNNSAFLWSLDTSFPWYRSVYWFCWSGYISTLSKQAYGAFPDWVSIDQQFRLLRFED